MNQKTGAVSVPTFRYWHMWLDSATTGKMILTSVPPLLSAQRAQEQVKTGRLCLIKGSGIWRTLRESRMGTRGLGSWVGRCRLRRRKYHDHLHSAPHPKQSNCVEGWRNGGFSIELSLFLNVGWVYVHTINFPSFYYTPKSSLKTLFTNALVWVDP